MLWKMVSRIFVMMFVGSIFSYASFERPLYFEKNKGQFHQDTAFLARAAGYHCLITPRSVEFILPLDDKSLKVGMELIGADAGNNLEGHDLLPSTSHYFIGNEPSAWRQNVPHFQKVIHRDVYANVDIVYLSDGRDIRYDFVVRPGGNPNQIRMRFHGADSVKINRKGELEIAVGAAKLVHKKPSIFQELNGERKSVSGRFIKKGKREIGFSIGRYDKGQTLIIDPTVRFSSFLGGSGDDQFWGIAAGRSGSRYLTGYSSSLNWPTLNPVQGSRAGMEDAVVVKLSPNNQLVWSTYFGGSRGDFGTGIALTDNEDVYITGITASLNFPLVSATQSGFAGGGFDSFVFGLSNDGQQIRSSTYLGGNGLEFVPKIGIDLGRNVYVVGQTSSTNFPVTSSAFQSTNAGQEDGFLTAFKLDPWALRYSTYFGGSANDYLAGIAVDPDRTGVVYTVGASNSSNIPTTANAIQPQNAGGFDAMVQLWRIDLDFSSAFLDYCSYLGGSQDDFGAAIAIDGTGRFYFGGTTSSPNFPTLNPIQGYGGAVDGFVAQINPAMSGQQSLTASSFLGGNGDDTINSIAVSPSDQSVYLAGSTQSNNIPTTDNAFRRQHISLESMWLLAFKADLIERAFESYKGESGFNTVFALALMLTSDDFLGGNPSDRVMYVGRTSSNLFPIMNPLQAAYGGGPFDGVLFEVDFERGVQGDVNDDGCVNDTDLLLVLFAFGNTGENQQEDLNGDGIVNDTDLLLVLFNFGNGC